MAAATGVRHCSSSGVVSQFVKSCAKPAVAVGDLPAVLLEGGADSTAAVFMVGNLVGRNGTKLLGSPVVALASLFMLLNASGPGELGMHSQQSGIQLPMLITARGPGVGLLLGMMPGSDVAFDMTVVLLTKTGCTDCRMLFSLVVRTGPSVDTLTQLDRESDLQGHAHRAEVAQLHLKIYDLQNTRH